MYIFRIFVLDKSIGMAQKSKSKKSPLLKERGTLSIVLSRKDNDLLRDYRYTQIMRSHNTELTLMDVLDEILDVFRAEYDSEKASSIVPEEIDKENAVKEIRTVFSIRQKDLELLKQYKIDRILATGDIGFSLSKAMMCAFEIFRQTLNARGYELTSRPQIVRLAEVKKRSSHK